MLSIIFMIGSQCLIQEAMIEPYRKIKIQYAPREHCTPEVHIVLNSKVLKNPPEPIHEIHGLLHCQCQWRQQTNCICTAHTGKDTLFKQ